MQMASNYSSSLPPWADGVMDANQDSLGLDQESVDHVRLARDHWIVRPTHVSDSSAIIDSIDIDMIDAGDNETTTEIYLVLDTNILIRYLSVLKDAVVRIEAEPTRLPVVMLVPGIVVSELDYQKTSSMSIAFDSRKGSDWLARTIGNENGRVKGQAYTQTMLPSGDWRQRSGLSNDELILDCCQYFTHVKRKDVLLCTRDNNLAVQASVNATNLFVRGTSGVIRPSGSLWGSIELLDCAVPGYGSSTSASIHSTGYLQGGHNRQTRKEVLKMSSRAAPRIPPDQDGSVMEVDMDNCNITLPNMSQKRSCRDRRDTLHKQMAEELRQHLRKLTGMAARLQEHRRQTQSIYSPDNTQFTGQLPTENEWSHEWSLRDCLRFLAKISPPRRRTWTFSEGESSTLADFLGLLGERGARPGREWSKFDWGNVLRMIQLLAEDFEYHELDVRRMAEYEWAVLEAFTEA